MRTITAIHGDGARRLNIHCERCEEKLDESNAVWLELDQDTGLYHTEGAIPEDHASQGSFPFGRACAASVLKAGGRNNQIRAAARG